MTKRIDAAVSAAWAQLRREASAGRSEAFDPAELTSTADAVRRYFARALVPGTPLAHGVRLEMRGQIKIRRWLGFTARQLLVPRRGTVWTARVASVIEGSDRFVDGVGGMDWRLLGLLPLVHADGGDVTRSSAERAAGESIWVPTAMVRHAPSWTAEDDHRIRAPVEVGGHPVVLHHYIDDAGLLQSSHFERWGDPDDDGGWSLHPFGVKVDGHDVFGGVTIPSRGTAGWHFGTERWDDGMFFRYEITGYQLIDLTG